MRSEGNPPNRGNSDHRDKVCQNTRQNNMVTKPYERGELFLFFCCFFIYLQTSPKTIWQEKSQKTKVPITRLLNTQRKVKKKKKKMIQNN